MVPIRTIHGFSFQTFSRQPREQDPIHAELLRRIDACAASRHAAALAPDGIASMAEWKRHRDRGDKLRRALLAHLISSITAATR